MNNITIYRPFVVSLRIDVAIQEKTDMIAEEKRLEEDRIRKAYWRRWEPYLSERQWDTVREDYSPYGTGWDYFPHDHPVLVPIALGEDRIGGISDNRPKM